MGFIDSSLTSYHAVCNIRDALLGEGFAELSEQSIWSLEAGGKYFVTRGGAAVIAFRIPEGGVDKVKGYHIFAAHSDSPAFKVKELPEMEKEGAYVSINTEKYGGMIMSTWLDRPLTIAGRVCVEHGGKLETHPVRLGDNICVIPSLAIHMNRDVNKGVELSAQGDMLPLLGMAGDSAGKGMIRRMLAETLGGMAGMHYNIEDILAYDLFVVNSEKAVLAGADCEFVMSPRYDDLACVYAGLKGLIGAVPRGHIAMLAVFDNEEVGSCTRQGADSTFLKDTLENMADGLGVSANTCRVWRAGSFMLSADNAHACHPNQSGKADPTNRPYLNKGIVLKYHGGQKYATDAYSAAYVKKLCRENDIPLQTYANNSDIAGGSTLGNIIMAQASMSAADIGLPQLAMHSAYETAGAKDAEYMVRLAEGLFGM